MEITGKNNAGEIIARNLSDIGKHEEIEQVDGAALEPDLLFPLLRGRDVGRWRAESSAFLLNVQNAKERRGYDEDWLKDKFPLACAYLLKFENLLRQRSGFKKYFCKEVGKGAKKRLEPFAPFYSLYNIGEYTLAPFKVCWREQAEFFTASVAGKSDVADQSKVIIPDHKLMFVPLGNEIEAHFVCAAINSSPSVLVVKSYGIETQTSTHVLEHVRLPKFDANDNLHQRLAKLSQQAHTLATESEPDTKRIEAVETEIDAAAAELWSITPAELSDIKSSLADLR